MNSPKRLGVHGLITNEAGLYLVMKRSDTDSDDRGNWDLPGGGVDENESVEAGFRREVEEETGLAVSDIRIIYAYTADDDSLQLIVTVVVGNTEVKLSYEHSEFRWVTKEELMMIEPAGLHLKAVKYLLKTGLKIARYEEYK